MGPGRPIRLCYSFRRRCLLQVKNLAMQSRLFWLRDDTVFRCRRPECKYQWVRSGEEDWMVKLQSKEDDPMKQKDTSISEMLGWRTMIEERIERNLQIACRIWRRLRGNRHAQKIFFQCRVMARIALHWQQVFADSWPHIHATIRPCAV